MNRRRFLNISTIAAAGSFITPSVARFAAAGPGAPIASGEGRMKMALNTGRIGAGVDQMQAIELAATYGFEAVSPQPDYLSGLSGDEMKRLKDTLQQNNLVLSAADLPVAFRGGENEFRRDLLNLGSFARTLERAGVTRAGTWISSSHDRLTYWENFQQHVRRLRQIAEILVDHGIRLGLEYLGPKTSWASGRYPFIHTMAETKDLIDAIDCFNVGFILDSWHWYTAGEDKSDILTLANMDVVAVDLNDAVAGIPREEQVDGRRKLPMATGVINTEAFLTGLQEIGYVGPVRAEPFSQEVNAMPAEQAIRVTSEAMKEAFALIR